MPPELNENSTITVHLEGHSDLVLNAAALAKMPRHSAEIVDHGNKTSFEGVFLRDVLAQAGAPFGDRLKGKALATYVLATGRDGYAATYTLTEMDPAFNDGELLIADRSQGGVLPPKQGPFRIVVPHDKKQARSVRMLERIDVVELRK